MSISIARALAVAAFIGASALVASPARADLVYGLNEFGTNLFSFDSSTPGSILNGKAITGMASNEQMQAIDFRTADGKLYGVGSFGNLYTINTATGAVTSVGNFGSLNGVNFGSDFNPVADRLRIVSEVGSNIRVDPTTGALTATDTNLSYAAGDSHAGAHPNVVDLAYTANGTGYGIDSALDTLVLLSNPNGGILNTVGSLGLDAGAVGGLDISPAGTAYAAFLPTGSSISNFYTVNLTTGVASLVGQIDGGFVVRDIAVVIPEPASLTLLALAAPALLLRRRKA
jgi:hypothetical protein